MNLLTNSNQKIKKTAKLNGKRLYDFNIPAVATCPFAKDCKTYCYADKGLFRMQYKKYQFQYELSKDSKKFTEMIQSEIDKKKVEAIRVHSSGDFYSLQYLKTWVNIAVNNPKVIFYGYTKSVPLFNNINPPSNFVFCFSTGGTHDHLIKSTDKKAVIFKSEKDLKKANFVDCSKDDMRMITTDKIGLIYH